VRTLGLRFPTPLGVAAGLDKDATWYADLLALGFGFVEVGTVTARPQAGNPRPRIERLHGQRALINRMGFPNPGAGAVAERLSSRSAKSVVGANVGKSRAVELQDAVADYRESVRRLAGVADYIALNVSSPNTPGLRELQSVERLRELVQAVRSELQAGACPRPILVKLAPDLSDEELDAVAGLALELDLDGLIAVNTTAVDGGGLSGAPLAPRAEQVLRRLRQTAGSRLVIVSVGGIESAQDVWMRLEAGATLVQAYTALVYAGPAWPSRVNRELVRLLEAAGYDSLQDMLERQAKASDARAVSPT
jgi:dihydroorotate dehydrogenase